jgi:radical SAM superfamily enzyme YgiQ (UPF0313 family)
MIERNVVSKDFRNMLRVALVYPNYYRVGMSNLGFQILYALLNSLKEVYAERFFLDMPKSLETGSRLKNFDIIAFTWQFELDALNILETLHRDGIPLRRERREQTVIVGGPCAFNPLPLANFADFFFIGEAEANLLSFIQTFIEGDRESLTDIPGVYSPEEDNNTKRVYLENLDDFYPVTQVMSSESAFGETFLLEVSRGCKRGCRFCMSGYTFRPYRYRSLEGLMRIADEGIKINAPKKISLLGASVSDYPYIDELCNYLSTKGLELSIPSLRADSLSPAIVEALVRTGQRSITLAPESTERVRIFMNKPITDEDLYRAVKMATMRGIKNIKLYFIIGTPAETLEDIAGIVALIKKLRRISKKLRLSVNPLVPKPHTPFQWLGMEDPRRLKEKLKVLREAHVWMEVEDLKSAHLQATIAMGDKRLSNILEKAFYYGKGMGAFRKAFKEEGLDFNYYIRGREPSEPLPWDKIDVGVRKSYLIAEYEKSLRGEVSPGCSDSCRACGVC